MPYELYYWPSIQGRGEFIRLALEEAGAAYIDVARERGTSAMMKLMSGTGVERPPYAPPFIRDGRRIVAQTANILLYLSSRLGLAPADEASRLWLHQLQLTISDLVVEILASDRRQLLGITNRMRALEGVVSTETFLYLDMVKQLYDWGAGARVRRDG